MDVLFPYGNTAHWVSSSGFVLTLWLGAYLTTHASRSSPARLAILALFSMSGYFLHTVLCLFLPAEQAGYLWRRYMGWLALTWLPIWLHLTYLLRPPAERTRLRAPVRMTYAVMAVMSVAWAAGDWSFSRETLLPPELIWPISLFVASVGIAALVNIWQMRRKAADDTLRVRHTLLGVVVLLVMIDLLYWPAVVNWLKVPWTPTNRLVIGESILLAAAAVLAYLVAYHNGFMAGRWVRRDFYFHAVTVVTIAALYVLTMLGAWRLAERFGFDVPTLALIAVVGLAILTHLLALPARQWWDRLFFRQMRTLPREFGSLMRARETGGQLDEQMRSLVMRLQELTGASTACLALCTDGELMVKASTERERIGLTVPLIASRIGAAPQIGPRAAGRGNGLQQGLWDCMVLAEPIPVRGAPGGYLLLGERGVGEGYDRQERVWVSSLAALIGAAVEKAQRREEIERRIEQLDSEARDLASQEQALQEGFEAALAGRLEIFIDRTELREAVCAYNRPERLAAIIEREESTLARLPFIAGSGAPAQCLQEKLTAALQSVVPPDGMPPLDALRERAVRKKRRRHLPMSAADYYTLRLVMSGYTQEAVAEMLDVSSRQVRNYLDHGLGTVMAFLVGEGAD